MLHRAGKVVASRMREDIVSSVVSLQVCAGKEAGCGSATIAMHTIYENIDQERMFWWLILQICSIQATGMSFYIKLQ